MDNKVTKNRLANFFTYHWITFLCAVLAVIFAWELIYTVFAVKLTTGQNFRYYYDQNLGYVNYEGFEKIIDDEKPFSYDVILSDFELLNTEYNALSARLVTKKGDAIFTDDYKGAGGDAQTRARTIIDSESVINYERLLKNGKEYLANFLKEEYKSLTQDEKEELAIDYSRFNEVYDREKIKQNFLSRNKRDNRFRKAEDREQGIASEIVRIEKLAKEISDFDYLLKNAPKDLFFRYTKFSQAIEFADERFLANYIEYQQDEISNGKENVIYGIKLEELKGGENKKKTKDYFRLSDFSTSEKIVLLVFDFTNDQPDLQYETVSFINMVVRTFSDLYDNR